MTNNGTGGYDRSAILADVLHVLRDVTADWDTDLAGPMGPGTRLVADLQFESIDMVQFVVAIEECYQRRGLPFEELMMVNGRYVDEIKVSDMVDFLYDHLNQLRRKPEAAGEAC